MLVAVEEEEGEGEGEERDRDDDGNKGESSTFPSPPLPSSSIVGVAALLRSRPEALLPPPAPTRAPLVPYLGNLAVAPAARGRGVARRLLSAAERAAAAFGDSELWLRGRNRSGSSDGEDSSGNLYFAAGYRRVEQEQEGESAEAEEREERGEAAASRDERVLLRKRLSPPPPRRRGAANEELRIQRKGKQQELAGGGTGEGGAYLWRVVEVEDEGRGGAGETSFERRVDKAL